MQCRNCGTEIAEKAIVCFRCGQSTTDPVRKPAQIAAAPTRGRSLIVAAVLALVLSLPLLVMPEATPIPESARAAGALLAAGGGLLLGIRLIRRR